MKNLLERRSVLLALVVGGLSIILAGVLILYPSAPESANQPQAQGALDPQGTPLPTATFPPGVTPPPATVGPIPSSCQPGIELGKMVRVVHRAVRMRHSPGYVLKDDYTDSKRYMERGDMVIIRGGPQMMDGLCWWLIEYEGVQGWTADHNQEGRLLLSP
jgi:hypothetical protein